MFGDFSGIYTTSGDSTEISGYFGKAAKITKQLLKPQANVD